MLQKPLASLSQLGSDLGQPDGSFHSFDLAKEWPNIGELVVTPVLKKTLGIGRDFPVVGVGEAAPLVNVVAELVDNGRSRVVLLLLGREPFALIENYLLLPSRTLALPRLRDGRDELGAPAAFNNPLRRLALFIELPIASRVLVWRIENRPLEKLIVHTCTVGQWAGPALALPRAEKKLPLNITLHAARRPQVGHRAIQPRPDIPQYRQ